MAAHHKEHMAVLAVSVATGWKLLTGLIFKLACAPHAANCSSWVTDGRGSLCLKLCQLQSTLQERRAPPAHYRGLWSRQSYPSISVHGLKSLRSPHTCWARRRMACNATSLFLSTKATKTSPWCQLEASALLQEMRLPSHQLRGCTGHNAASKEMGSREQTQLPPFATPEAKQQYFTPCTVGGALKLKVNHIGFILPL